MDPKIEIRYYSSPKALSEFARRYSVGPKPLVSSFSAVVVIGLAATYLYWGVPLREWKTIGLLALLLGVLQLLPNYYAWSVHRNTKKQNDGVLPETVVTFGDAIEMHEGMVHLTIEYRKLIKGVRLKHSYVLMTGKRTAVMLDLDGFTKGSVQELQELLREKCPGMSMDGMDVQI